MRAAFPNRGPAWDAAIEFGIDVFLLEANLALTPEQRLMQLDDMLRLAEEFDVAREALYGPEIARRIKESRESQGSP
jgi:hypothetical protein